MPWAWSSGCAATTILITSPRTCSAFPRPRRATLRRAERDETPSGRCPAGDRRGRVGPDVAGEQGPPREPAAALDGGAAGSPPDGRALRHLDRPSAPDRAQSP